MQDGRNMWLASSHLWNDNNAHKSLLPCAENSGTALNVCVLGHQHWGLHFWAVTCSLELDGLGQTFSLEFRFLILHFCL